MLFPNDRGDLRPSPTRSFMDAQSAAISAPDIAVTDSGSRTQEVGILAPKIESASSSSVQSSSVEVIAFAVNVTGQSSGNPMSSPAEKVTTSVANTTQSASKQSIGSSALENTMSALNKTCAASGEFFDSPTPRAKTSQAGTISTSAEVIGSSSTELHMSVMNTAESPSEQLDRLISKLPLELKIMVLKEYFREWASRGRLRVTTPGLPGFRLCQYSTEPRLTDPRLWHALSVYSKGCPDIFALVKERTDLNLFDRKSKESHRARRTLLYLRLSKCYGPSLDRFFFGHTIWQFQNYSQYFKAFRGHFGGTELTHEKEGSDGSTTSPSLPLKWMNMMKCLGLFAENWYKFEALFRMVHKTLIANDSLLKNLEMIQIAAPNRLTRKEMQSEGPGMIDMKGYYPMEHESDRLQDLVRRCREIVSKRPNIMISLKGPSYNQECSKRSIFECDLDEFLWTEEAMVLAGRGFGYSANETQEFLAGTSNILLDLENIDLPNTRENLKIKNFEHYHIAYHWQMVFAEEWKKACGKGAGWPNQLTAEDIEEADNQWN